MSDTKPPDAFTEEFEPLKEVESELKRLVSHPRSEAKRLQAVAEEGESGATPLIEVAIVASLVIPLLLLTIGFILGVSFLVVRFAP